jgi:uncharacterized membrane protein YsdA (DUF1294 family)
MVVLIYYSILTLLGFLLTGMDKLAALSNAWRTSERSFYTLALCGGGVGILLGAFAFRHKTRKPSFLWRVGAATLVNAVLVVVLILAL